MEDIDKFELYVYGAVILLIGALISCSVAAALMILFPKRKTGKKKRRK